MRILAYSSNNGFQGSQPFITKDNDKYDKLTEEELKLILEYEKQKVKKIIMSLLRNKN